MIFSPPRPARHAPERLPWQAMCLLALLLPAGNALALSSACSALNAASGSTRLNARWNASDFAAGEQVSFGFADNGQDATRSALTAEVVNVRSRDTSTRFFDYRTDTGTEGRHSGVVSSSQLTTQGLYVRISTGSYIGPVSITCAGAQANDASLSSLGVSAGSLSPAFTPGEQRYRLAVSNATESLTLRPVLADRSAGLSVNGSPLAPAADSPAINLNEGSNTITLVVTAADRSNSRTYNLDVNRAQALPEARDVSTTVAADSTNHFINLNISGNASSVNLPTNASHGFATASGTTVTYTPNAGFSGTDSFTYSASNDAGTSPAATVTITVTPR